MVNEEGLKVESLDLILQDIGAEGTEPVCSMACVYDEKMGLPGDFYSQYSKFASELVENLRKRSGDIFDWAAIDYSEQTAVFADEIDDETKRSAVKRIPQSEHELVEALSLFGMNSVFSLDVRVGDYSEYLEEYLEDLNEALEKGVPEGSHETVPSFYAMVPIEPKETARVEIEGYRGDKGIAVVYRGIEPFLRVIEEQGWTGEEFELINFARLNDTDAVLYRADGES